MKMRDVFKEDAVAANNLSAGHIEGTGGEGGEPGVKKKKKLKGIFRRAEPKC